MDDQDHISAATLAAPLRGRQLTGATLGEELERGRQLLVFLRHLG